MKVLTRTRREARAVNVPWIAPRKQAVIS